MALNFPSTNLTPGVTTYRYGIRTWLWNGVGWQLQINPAFGYGTTTLPGDLTVNGSLTVNGNTTTLNTVNMTVDDKNIIFGSVLSVAGLSTTAALTTGSNIVTVASTVGLVPGQTLTKVSGTGAFGAGATISTVDTLYQFTTSVNHATAGNITSFTAGSASDLTAAGGGLTLKGATDKTILWDSNYGWSSSENFNVQGTTKTYKVNGANALQGSSTQMIVGSQATALVLGGTGTTITVPGTFSIGALTNPTIATGIQTTTNSFDFIPTQATNINIGRAATTIYAGSTGTNTFAVQGTTTTVSFPSSTAVTYSSGGTSATISWHAGSSIQHTMASNTYALNIGGLQTAQSVTANFMANATASGNTKTLNIGTSGVGGSVTNINFGSPTTNAQGTVAIQSNTFIGGFVSSPVQAITSGTTIAPTQSISFIQGTTAIATITAPSNILASGGQVTLLPQAAFTTTTAGNIQIASTAVAGRAMVMTYNPLTSKWYPSY
jgi:hypothetical protein